MLQQAMAEQPQTMIHSAAKRALTMNEAEWDMLETRILEAWEMIDRATPSLVTYETQAAASHSIAEIGKWKGFLHHFQNLSATINSEHMRRLPQYALPSIQQGLRQSVYALDVILEDKGPGAIDAGLGAELTQMKDHLCTMQAAIDPHVPSNAEIPSDPAARVQWAKQARDAMHADWAASARR